MSKLNSLHFKTEQSNFTIDVIIDGNYNSVQFGLSSGKKKQTIPYEEYKTIIIHNKADFDVKLIVLDGSDHTIYNGDIPAKGTIFFSQSSGWINQPTGVERIVGYSYVSVTDVVKTLDDGVDDLGASALIPEDATGATIFVEFTSTEAELRYTVNNSTPNSVAKRGIPIYENNDCIHIGNICASKSKGELSAFKAVMNTGKTCLLHVTYYRK